jgi:hypothetical protein
MINHDFDPAEAGVVFQGTIEDALAQAKADHPRAAAEAFRNVQWSDHSGKVFDLATARARYGKQ